MTSQDSLPRLWLIGGTRESAQIAQAIAQRDLPCLITITTESAKRLYPDCLTQQIRVGALSQSELPVFCRQAKIQAIIDASHPFATMISANAIAIANQMKLPYLRYERPGVSTTQDSTLELPDFAALFAGNYLPHQRVLLTIGSQALSLFQAWHDRSRLFARILPSTVALKKAIAAGFTADRLIAMRPPIGEALEAALWRQWHISLVVTKASGQAGGEVIKRSVAAALGIPLIIIARPPVKYPQQTSDLATVLRFCEQSLS